MRIFFASRVVDGRPLGYRGRIPAIELVRRATRDPITGALFPCRWEIDGVIVPPVAVGVAEVSTDQALALDAETRVIAFSTTALRTEVRSLNPVNQTRLRNVLEGMGESAGDGEVLEDIADRLMARVCARRLNALLLELADEILRGRA